MPVYTFNHQPRRTRFVEVDELNVEVVDTFDFELFDLVDELQLQRAAIRTEEAA